MTVTRTQCVYCTEGEEVIISSTTHSGANTTYVHPCKLCGVHSSLFGKYIRTKSMETVDKGRPSLTYGQKAMGVSFNPSQDPAVDFCKTGFAALADQMDGLRHTSVSSEQKRLASAAITQMQLAQMMAVKALTWSD